MGQKTQWVPSVKKICSYKSQGGRWQNNQIQGWTPFFDIPGAALYLWLRSATSCGLVAALCLGMTRHLRSNSVGLLLSNPWPQHWGFRFPLRTFLLCIFLISLNINSSSLSFWNNFYPYLIKLSMCFVIQGVCMLHIYLWQHIVISTKPLIGRGWN